MGQPEGGFPEELQKIVLKGEKAITDRPGELLPPEDFNKIEEYLKGKYKYNPSKKDVISYALYPEVFEGSDSSIKMANAEDKLEIGASIPGTIIKVLVEKGQQVKEGESLLTIEAMKMETNIVASMDGTIDSILVSEGQQVKTGQLLVKLK